jgi:hypothetical protein
MDPPPSETGPRGQREGPNPPAYLKHVESIGAPLLQTHGEGKAINDSKVFLSKAFKIFEGHPGSEGGASAFQNGDVLPDVERYADAGTPSALEKFCWDLWESFSFLIRVLVNRKTDRGEHRSRVRDDS